MWKIEGKRNLKQWEKIPVSHSRQHWHFGPDSSSLPKSVVHTAGCSYSLDPTYYTECLTVLSIPVMDSSRKPPQISGRQYHPYLTTNDRRILHSDFFTRILTASPSMKTQTIKVKTHSGYDCTQKTMCNTNSQTDRQRKGHDYRNRLAFSVY